VYTLPYYRYNLLIKNTEFKESEQARGRDKYRRLYKGIKQDPAKKKEVMARYVNLYPEKAVSRNLSQHLKKPGFEKHHWSYRVEHTNDIIWMVTKDHAKAHRFIVYDQEQMMYRSYNDNELLDTKEKHQQFIEWCIANKPD